MARAARRRPIYVDPNAKVWTTQEDVYLMENQEEPLREQAVIIGCTEEEVSNRRAVLGLIRRAKALIKLG